MGLLVSDGLLVTSCLSGLNMHSAGAKLDWSLLADGEIWPESPNVNRVN